MLDKTSSRWTRRLDGHGLNHNLTQRKYFSTAWPTYPLTSPIHHVILHKVSICQFHVKPTRNVLQSPGSSEQIPVISTISNAKRRNWKMCMLLLYVFWGSHLFAGLYLELHAWLLTCVCDVCVLIWRPVDSNISTSFVTLKQRGSSFRSSNFAPWKNCSLKMKYIQGLIPLLKQTRNQPRNREFQEQTTFKPEKQAIVPKMNGKRQTISTTTTVTSIVNILRFICSRRCWFDGSWLPGAMVCFSLNPIAA